MSPSSFSFPFSKLFAFPPNSFYFIFFHYLCFFLSFLFLIIYYYSYLSFIALSLSPLLFFFFLFSSFYIIFSSSFLLPPPPPLSYSLFLCTLFKLILKTSGFISFIFLYFVFTFLSRIFPPLFTLLFVFLLHLCFCFPILLLDHHKHSPFFNTHSPSCIYSRTLFTIVCHCLLKAQ